MRGVAHCRTTYCAQPDQALTVCELSCAPANGKAWCMFETIGSVAADLDPHVLEEAY